VAAKEYPLLATEYCGAPEEFPEASKQFSVLARENALPSTGKALTYYSPRRLPLEVKQFS
jgi:hypothetical protein